MDPPPDVVLETDSLSQLNTSDARSLLNTIDGLRALGVGDFVHLPQIIVVGDQSSGKSSVLEAISRVRFPVDGDLCTRFATEFVLRRAPVPSINVSIQFADAAAQNATGNSPNPPPAPFEKNSFDKDALPDIIREAKERMGISNNGAKRFSKDILHIEVASPDVYPLTLVDLPGMFHSSTEEQNDEDRQLVNGLIDSYMELDKSIILLVVAANHPLANQAVLSTAARHDPDRKRTIGVITKPDMAGRGSANEKKYLDLAKGRESMHRLALGWYVLRNRSEEERSSEAEVRDTVEERFFRTSEWNSISSANRGIESLRKQLSEVLLEHIKKNIPSLIGDIETRLRARQQDLTHAGKPRSTPEELRSYLLGIAEEFQRLARDAVEGRYNDPFFGGFDQDDTRLLKFRALLRNMNSAFVCVMKRKGSSYKIEWEDAEVNESANQESCGEIAEYLQPLYELYNVPDPEPKPESDLNAMLQPLAFSSRGREFPGDTNPELVFSLFKKQSAPWEGIAQEHLDHVISAARGFVHRVFRHVTGADDATLNSLLHDCVDPFFDDKEETLRVKLREIITPYKDSYGPPLDAAFYARMEEKTSHRFASQFATRLERQCPELFRSGSGAGARLTRQMILNAIDESSRAESNMFDTKKVIHRMVVYYEMSQKTFVDNIINLAIESCLVHDLTTILTPTKVDGMDSERLRYLASETEDLQRQRQELEQEVTILREGLRKCQRHRPRQDDVLPSALLRLSTGVPGEASSRAVTPEPSVTPAGDPTPSPAPEPSATPAAAVPHRTQPASVQPPPRVSQGFGQPGSNNNPPKGTSPWVFNSKPSGTAEMPPRSGFDAWFGASGTPFGTSSLSGGSGGFSSTNTAPGTTPFGSGVGSSGSSFANKPFGTTSFSSSSFVLGSNSTNTNTNTNTDSTRKANENPSKLAGDQPQSGT
ncbi:P-loop containing nucleoside triphosphate hydrolase protein [Chaetomium sp. MPI-CAGE-AT-0009]|nr:P-loop containing nucleoside triphosphate hydrolase protein [Chaetomium sp. MPI-CAGE-AT-0009]